MGSAGPASPWEEDAPAWHGEPRAPVDLASAPALGLEDRPESACGEERQPEPAQQGGEEGLSPQ